MELYLEAEKINKQLDQALSTLRENGIKYCEAERVYQMAKSKAILKLKSEGYPVTLIPSIVKGLDEIAELDFNRNVCEVVYKANMEALLIKKLQLKVKENEIERMYNDARND